MRATQAPGDHAQNPDAGYDEALPGRNTGTGPEGVSASNRPSDDTAIEPAGDIATLIETAKTATGLNQGALAARLGISGGQLSSAKTGRYGLGSDALAKLQELAESSDAPPPATPAPITPGPGAAPTPAPIRLPISVLIVDPEIQQRVSINDALVAEYAADIHDWIGRAPIDVFFDADGKRIVADGFHRVAACRTAGIEDIPVRLQQGTRRDALLFAVGANAAHGLRRSNADKRKAVETLLQDPEWSQWSDRAIAAQVKVSDKTVASVRRDILNCGTPQLVATASADHDRPQLVTATSCPDASPMRAAAPAGPETPVPVPPADKPAATPDKRIGKDGRSRSAPAAKAPAPAAAPKSKAPTAKDAMHAAHAVQVALVALERFSGALLPEDCATLVEHLEQALERYRLTVEQGADHA
ncbi:ParB/RepB/Spo0J family partition protein [uncultured Thiodictyon sp.]|uniref:ParB/RepB/Spo0J family partition protein n=1 Tax=uncultured Thiodictyon sp. TaxID=1846217 RepID=UPI0025E5BA51|nr:ParB/RepB/Spo0J family partition protein [uncultured Thiodictyon sp.]